jgi:hypothetical protein
MKQISFADIGSRSGLFSLLLFSGYLNPKTVIEPTRTIIELAVPNQEVKFLYETRLLQWISNQLQMDSSLYYPLVGLLPAGKIEEFQKNLKELLLHSTSFHQVGEKKAELFYSGFMLGMVHILSPNYTITSEQESGDGRADLMLIPKSGKGTKALIIEYKVAKNQEGLLAVAQMGLKQILDKQYETILRKHTDIQEVIKISMAFSGKYVEMVWQTEIVVKVG